MYLKSLEIQGFKSFANKTELTFLPPQNGRHSVTVIVGPNGSGKSNVSDAIRWVMGEQSMKSLRGKKSEDIIFAGSASKGKMGICSVSMVIDNSDKKVPLDYEEIIITRKLYRDGQSEYLINGLEARLLDIQILLARAQFGQGSYSLVGQGTIDKILLQTPAERLEFFDEASGIKELQIKRHQSWLKLEKTREHMNQANMLLQEVLPRLKTLTRQVKKLEERQEVETNLRALQEQYYATIWTDNAAKIKNAKSNLEKISLECTGLEQNLNNVQMEIATLVKGENSERAMGEWQENYKRLMREKGEKEREKAEIENKISAGYVNVGKREVGWLQNKVSNLKSRAEELTLELNNLQSEYQNGLGKLEELEKELREANQKKFNLQKEIEKIEESLNQSKSDQNIFQFTGLRAVQSILDEKARFGGVCGALAQLGRVEKQYQMALEVAAGTQISSLVVNDDSVAELCINYLRDNRLGIATFLPLNKIQARPIPMELLNLNGRVGVVGVAVDLVKFADKYEPAFLYVFGNTLVVENLSAARNIGIGHVRMVTLQGDLLDRGGSMRGGFRREKQYALSFATGSGPYLNNKDMEREAAVLLEKKSELHRVNSLVEELSRRLADARSLAQTTKGKIEMVESQISGIKNEFSGLESELKLANASPTEYDAVVRDLSDRKNILANEISALIAKESEMQNKMEEIRALEEKRKQKVFFLQDEMQSLQSKLGLASQAKNAEQVEIAKIETRAEDLAHEIVTEMHVAVESILSRGIELVEIAALEDLAVEIQKNKYKLSLIGGIDEEVVKEFQETKERHDVLSTELIDLEKAAGDLEKLVIELDEMMKKKRDFAFKKIKKEFTKYFGILFEGGKADLIELYEDESKKEESDIANGEVIEGEIVGSSGRKKKVLSGIDVVACPLGKKISNIQALSGGERTLTSIALICAILKTNPSPFVLLDEVEAALDEANTMRFVSILKDLALESQFILISHNRATMHAGDVLYGVTMNNDGISRLMSVKLG